VRVRTKRSLSKIAHSSQLLARFRQPCATRPDHTFGALDKPLRRPLAFAVSDWPRKLNGLAEALRFLVSRGVASNLDEVVAKLATMTAWPQLAAVVQFWVDGLPLPQMMPPTTVGRARRLDRVDELASLARAWRNCLGDYRSAIDAGSCAVYLWQDAEKPAACLVWRHGRLGWFLDEVKGPRNANMSPNSGLLSILRLPSLAFRGAVSPWLLTT
jgi:hypothetical protein